MGLDELHQLLLQSCMSRRAFSEKTGQTVYAHCIKECGMEDKDAPSWHEAIDNINGDIEPFHFAIKRFQDEHSGKPWTAFVNTKSDDMATVATEYGPQEISYFRTLIKLIMKSGRRYAITTNDAKNAGQRASVRPPLKATEAEKILRTLVAKGWLVGLSVKVGSNRLEMYQLSSRARMELLHYLRDQYPSAMDEDFECKICNENVMKGLQCPINECKMRMHDHCSRTYFARQQQPQCPSCQEPWNGAAALRVGPEAPAGAGVLSDSSDDDDEADEDATQRQADANGDEEDSDAPAARRRQSKGKGKARAAPSSDAMEADGNEDEDGEQDPSQRKKSARAAVAQRNGFGQDSDEEDRKQTRRSSQRIVDDEEEEEQDELQDDEDDEDPISIRRRVEKEKAQAKKKRKAAGPPS